MNCNRVRAVLSEYLERDLLGSLTKVVGEHLETCSDCRAELEAYRRLVADLRKFPVSVPNDLHDEFRRRLRAAASDNVPPDETLPALRRGGNAVRWEVAFIEEWIVRHRVATGQGKSTHRKSEKAKPVEATSNRIRP